MNYPTAYIVRAYRNGAWTTPRRVFLSQREAWATARPWAKRYKATTEVATASRWLASKVGALRAPRERIR